MLVTHRLSDAVPPHSCHVVAEAPAVGRQRQGPSSGRAAATGPSDPMCCTQLAEGSPRRCRVGRHCLSGGRGRCLAHGPFRQLPMLIPTSESCKGTGNWSQCVCLLRMLAAAWRWRFAKPSYAVLRHLRRRRCQPARILLHLWYIVHCRGVCLLCHHAVRYRRAPNGWPVGRQARRSPPAVLQHPAEARPAAPAALPGTRAMPAPQSRSPASATPSRCCRRALPPPSDALSPAAPCRPAPATCSSGSARASSPTTRPSPSPPPSWSSWLASA